MEISEADRAGLKWVQNEQLLGKGTYGVVYMRTLQNLQVAVKRIQQTDLDEDREAQLMQECDDHPNVLKLYAVFEDQGFK